MDYVVLFVGDHELRACRVCLNIDDTLRPMDDLFPIYVQLSGLPVTSYDGLPKLACSVCRTHLHNATALFKRARQSYGVLKNYVGERGMLTNESLQQLSKIYYKPIYTRTRTKSFAVPKTLVPVVVLVKEELHNISSNKEEKPNTSKVKRKPNVTGVRREIQFRSLRNNSSPEVVEEEKIEDMEEEDDNNSTEEGEGTRTEKEYVNNESEEEYLNIESEEEDNNSVEEEGEETKTEEEVNYGLCVDDNNRTEEVDNNAEGEDNNAEGEDYRGEDTEEDGDPTYLEEEYLSESNSEEAEPLTKQSSKNKSKSTVKRLKNRYNNIMESKGLKEITEKKSKFLHWEQDLKAYCTAIVRSVKTTGKYKFYEHIIEKYINKVKPIDHDPPVAIDADNIDEIPTIVEEGKKEFYYYIVKKYIKKEIEQKEPLKIHMVTKVKKISCKSFKTVEDQEQFSQDYKCDFEYLSTMAEKIACLKTKKEEKKYKDATFKCELCYEGYMVEAAYKKHMINHDPSLPHECPVCHKRYDSRLLWGRHLLRHNAKMTCRLCGKISFATHIAKHHYLTHAGQEYTCEHCGKFFVRYKSKLEHVRIHHGSECCPLCYELFTPFGLRIHNARAHTKTFPCECGAVFSVSAARDSHRPYCGAGGRPCAVCGVGLPAEDELAWQKHIATHRTKKPRMFIQRSRGSAPITFICEVCAKIFKSEAALRLHQMSHTGEKPLQCAYCDRRFRYKTALEIHIRCHTGERPYKCMLCEKTFKAISALKVHQLVHTQERNFPCDLCPKAFQTKYTLKLHVRSVHQGLRTRIRIRKKQQTE